MTDPTAAFAKMVPGFDFLQGLVKNAATSMPGVGQWVAPTLDPDELEKRITDLRTVQFWLEQNAKLLGVTIQALEVQRMTLSTLKTMNVSMSDLTASLQIPVPAAAAAAPAAAPAPPPPAPGPAPASPPGPAAASATATAAAVPAGVADPLQWWGALTQQFSQLAASAMKESGADGGKNLAGTLVQQGLDAARAGFKQAAAQTAGAAPKSVAAKPSGAKRAPAAKRATAPRKRGGDKSR